MPLAHRALPLVGREQTLQSLWLEVAASASQGMRAAVVRGPAGSGKSRVLDAFAERARGSGATVVAGRAPSLGVHPYAALADALGAHVRSSPPAAGQIRRAGEALVRLVPALAAFENQESTGPPDALAVVQAGYRLVRQVTERRPLVVVIDDAHLADSESCEVLAALARHASDLPWTLVLGWRDPGDEVRAAPRRLLELLRRERGAADLTLEPLGAGAAGEMIAGLLGDGLPAPGLVDMVHRRSAGNPYSIQELVAWLRDSGRLQRAGLQWIPAEGSEAELPPSLEEALGERTRALPEPARAVLQWLAVAGGSADLGLLATVGGLDDEALAGGIDVLGRSGLVSQGDGRRADYRIDQPLVAESVRRDMGAAQRRLAHRALARALSARGAPAGVVAAHQVRAADPGDAEAIAAAMAAGTEAEARVGLREAVGWYAEAVALTTWAEDPDRLAALDRISELSGHAGGTGLGLQAVGELLARAPADDALRRATLLRRLASLRLHDGDTAGARAAVEEALALGAAGGPEAAALLAELALVAQMTMPVEEMLGVVARGRALAAGEGRTAPALILQAFESIGLGDSGEPRRGRELAWAAARTALESGEAIGFGYATFAAASNGLLLGALDDAAESVTGLIQLGEQMGLAWGTAWLHVLLGNAEVFRGDLAAALRSDLRAEELAQRHGASSAMPMAIVQTGLVLACQGRVDAARERLEEARRWLEERPSRFVEGWYWHAVGVAELTRDRPEAAVDALGRMAELFCARGPMAQVALRPELVHGLVAAGRGAEALAEAEAIDELIRARDVPLAAATSATALAAALCAAGQAEAGVSQAEQAAALADELLSPFLAARARGELGTALHVAGRTAAAREVLLDAHARLAAIPVARERDAVERRLGELGVRVAPPRPAPAPAIPTADGPLAGLSSRERDVAELAATGLSSRAIALRLTLSERTIENHLQRIYAKLGLHSRAELIARVAGTR